MVDSEGANQSALAVAARQEHQQLAVGPEERAGNLALERLEVSGDDSHVTDSAPATGSLTADATEEGQMEIRDHGEPAEVEEFRATVLARQAGAEESFVTHGDAGPRIALWSKNDPVTLFGAIGMSQSGWDKLSETFTRVASRFSDVSDFHFDVEVVGVDGDMAYTLGFERFNGSIAGRPVEPVLVRVTHIYRREDGAWKIVHRHADNPGPDTRMEGT